MPNVKSLVIRVEVDKALKSHKCQASKKHVINKGDFRLKVRNARSWDHYCSSCAQKIVKLDLEKLAKLKELIPDVEATLDARSFIETNPRRLPSANIRTYSFTEDSENPTLPELFPINDADYPLAPSQSEQGAL
jgi:hypothetical protein